MSQYYQTYYTTGEFAKLCHTTKETLFHYDDIGILKPKLVKENGYRYYLSYQYFEFDLIKVLQEVKMSLKEIKEFMEQRNSENFVNTLNEKYQRLEEEKKRIHKMQHRIEQSILMTKYGEETKHMVPFIQKCQAEHLLTICLPNRTMSDQDMMSYVSQHLNFCQEQGLTEELPLGSIIYHDQFMNKDYHENRYFVKLDEPFDNQRYVLKPEGLYATILHEGFYDTISESFDKLFQFVEAEGYRMVGDAYEYEIHNYFTVQDVEEYLISLSIRIDK